jgi:DNA-directed RNA polymerase specialized sigma24 family protein
MNDEIQRQLALLLPWLWRFALRQTRHQADAEDLLQRCCLQRPGQSASHHENSHEHR